MPGAPMTSLCLWAGTLAGHDLWTRIRAAGRAGFAGLSVAPAELDAVLVVGDEPRLRAELTRCGVALACLDPVASWLPDPVAAHPAHRVHAAMSAARCLELGERFGITLLNAIDVTWRALPHAAGAHLADFAARARRRGITVAVEAQVSSGIPNLAAAYELCLAAGPDVRLTIDTWHFFRDPRNRIADVPPEAVGALQLADGPATPGADPVVESTTGRLMPGEGSFALRRLLAATAPHPRCPVGPEVFTTPVPAARAAEVALRARDATERTLSGAAVAGQSQTTLG
ncbi:sugar phosphate isomerase/epimerase [Dactylosporangium sp. NPDC000555]|uniref:sugar phosphate isomerase/epimerase family protein n=1 Tax=Dactylosporangium sp. NPDC000555 TaxID=3154260 RepID=UPI0033295D2E